MARTSKKSKPTKRRCRARRKLTIAERAKKHGVTVAVFKAYLAKRRQLGRELLAGGHGKNGKRGKRSGKSQLSLWGE